ncbi:MBL fold metallo-hydrolase [Caldanaerobacter subterraneus]|uniref:Ribonuclease BN (tRNA processing enzyme) n=1 Tax=Caldanaerobacter subterraneus TaxID=911092 RepID=A0A4R2KJW8_9THEO|nr:MBL fold metallo-hydrolase [Caldanaerobacter subterraneus]TCO66815.1 ribonuclease BN (tRNA processing enzyme) [Caldanaerobacter subterraneus]
MKITVLGFYGPFPAPYGATSGYIVEDEDTHILLDCGSGVISRYQRYYDLNELKHVILSHLHSDHMSDMLVLRYALDILRARGTVNDPVNVYCPATPENVLEELKFKDVFKIHTINEETVLNIGEIEISFKKMNHPVETYAVKMKKGDKIFVYSADTVYTEELVALAEGADLLLCDGNFLTGMQGPHMTAAEAAEIAKKAGCKKLILTHLSPLISIKDYYDEAKKVFENTEIVRDFEVYVI